MIGNTKKKRSTKLGAIAMNGITLNEEVTHSNVSITHKRIFVTSDAQSQSEPIKKRSRSSFTIVRRKNFITNYQCRSQTSDTSSYSNHTHASSDQDKSHSSSSRESSCDQNECSPQKRCSLCTGAISNAKPSNCFHISKVEHICSHCYEEFRIGKPLYDRYLRWKQKWVNESRCVPSLRLYVLEELLPFWINCRKCGRFRPLFRNKFQNLTHSFVENFECAAIFRRKNRNACLYHEEREVHEVRENLRAFISSMSVPPLLRNSPAIFYLKNNYYLDELGISPVNAQYVPENHNNLSFMSPFNVPGEQSKALSLRPDVMEYDEVRAFPEFSIEPVPYLAMRNLVIALWNLNPMEFLDAEAYPLEVVVIGGGISGLGSARKLRSLGAKVTLLEARPKIGGRMQDDWSLGVAVGCGAQLITGIVNNPIVVMCEQTGVNYRLLSDECPLVDSSTGRLVSSTADRVVDEHFNCMLDVIGEWKQRSVNDTGLAFQLERLHEKLIKHLDFKWTKEFERLFQWQIGNVEFSCGAKLSEVSAVGQFAGSHALMIDGSSLLIERLAEGIDIRCGHIVEQVDYSKEKIQIKCKNAKCFSCDKVLICIPLTVLQRNSIKFVPELPIDKIQSFNLIGAGLIEKVAVRFPYCFWSGLLKDGKIDFFGNVPKSECDRGLFNIFYDFSTKGESCKPSYVLMSYVSGDSLELVNRKGDVGVIAEFVNTLRGLFPHADVPEPIGHMITHWAKDPWIGMSYSYVKVGASGDDYDRIASTVGDERIYFAGECTNRFYPQTMTGAYLSGLRETSKIIESWISKYS